MADRTRRIGEILVERGLSEATLVRALAKQAHEPRIRIGELLERLGVPAEDVARALAEQLGLEMRDPVGETVDLQVVWRLPREIAQRLRAMPLDAPSPRIVRVAMADPRDLETLKALEFRLNATVRPVVATAARIEEALGRFHGVEAVAGRVLGQVAPELRNVQLPDEHLELDAEKLGALLRGGGNRPYVDMVNFVLMTAIERRASDIHMEPQSAGTRVRFRVDGMLRHVVTLPPWAHAPIVSRVKVVGGMDMSEQRRPQDGKADLLAGGRTFTIRISTVPSRHGENVVIRLLDPAVLRTDLANLGWPKDLISRYYRMISSPAGMVLIAGPTGSGKSTTLYATIHRLNTETASIITVEDPVEYAVPGITQVQVNPRAGVTFATTVRSLLRQDPNVLVVGEVRDRETAEAAVDAANTGHLVLSTLHTSNSVAAITRMLDLGVPQYLLGAALTGVVTQRLLRRVCRDCSPIEEPTPEEWEMLGLSPIALGPGARRVGPGCDQCQDTGYRGRVGVYELLAVDDALGRLIQDRATEGALWDHFLASGHRTLLADAIDKVRAGITTLEEVARVVPSAEYPTGLIEQELRRIVEVAPAPPPTVATIAPATEPSPPAPPTQAAAVEPTTAPVRARPLVLAVDDAQEVLSLVELTLEDTYDVCLARDGVEALEAVRARKPDVVVLDVMMPRLTGYEVTEQLRSDPSTARLPVLMLSARGQTDHVKKGLHSGADDYLPKPFDPEELMLRIRALLRRAGVPDPEGRRRS